jgi:hypothetical protein
MDYLNVLNMYSRKFILLFAVLLIIIYFISLNVGDCIFNEKYIAPDCYSYIDASNMLFNEFKPHPTRTMGFALILGLPKIVNQTITNNQYIAFGIFINFLSWIGGIIFLHKTLSFFLKRKAAFWVTLFSVANLGCLATIFLVLTESVTSLLLSIILYYLVKFSRDKKFINLIFAVSIINLLVVIRPGFFYLSILLSFIILCFIVYKRLWNNKMYSLIIISLFPLIFQILMIYNIYGNLTPSYIDKITWYYYLGAETQSLKTNSTYNIERQQREINLKGKTWNEISQISSSDMKKQLSDNFPELIHEYIKNLFENTKNLSPWIVYTQYATNKKNIISTLLGYISLLQNVFYISLLGLSLILLIKYYKVNLAIYILIGIALYVFLTSGISASQGDRFHIIIYPMIMTIFLKITTENAYLRKWLCPP